MKYFRIYNPRSERAISYHKTLRSAVIAREELMADGSYGHTACSEPELRIEEEEEEGSTDWEECDEAEVRRILRDIEA